MPTRRDRRTVKLQSKLQYGPKENALAALIGQAKTAKKQDIRSARAAAKGSVKGSKAYRSDITRNYADAASRLAQTQADVAKVSGSTSDVSAELARASARQTQDQLLDRNETTSRIREAREGRRGDVRAIRQQFRGDLKDIASQLVSLQGEKGTYAATALEALGSERRKNRRENRQARKERRAEIRKTKLTEAGQTSRNQADITSAEKIAADKIAADKAKAASGPAGTTPSKSGKAATSAELKSFQTDVAKAIAHGKQAKKNNRSFNEALSKLTTGVRSGTNQGIPAISDQLALRAALQQVYYGYVKPDLARKIRNQRGVQPYKIPGLSKTGKPASGTRWPKPLRSLVG